MTDFTKTTNFTAKDNLTAGDPNKVIKGTQFDTEFDALATSSATKSNKVVSGTTNNVIKQSASGDLTDAGYGFSELSGDVTVTVAELNKLDEGRLNTIGSDVASATSLVLGNGSAFDVTGTTQITSIATVAVGTRITLQFDGILTFTHHATDLILTGAANITTAAGDIAVMYEYATGDWRCESYTPKDGKTVIQTLTTRGDILKRDASEETRLAIGSANTVLQSNGTDPSWGSLSYSNISFSNNIVQGDLAANSVGQSEVKATYQSIASPQYFIATGGGYVMGHTNQDNLANTNELHRLNPSDADTTTYSSRWQWSGSTTAYDGLRLYYINSSPPYNIGDGDVSMFIYAVVDNGTGEIDYMSSSIDPTWAYNGKTNIVPSRYGKDGKIYRNRRDMSGVPFTYDQAKDDPMMLSEYTAAFKSATIIEEEITQDLKNADMDDMPHPYVGNNLVGKTVVLLDPVSSVMEDLLAIQEHDDGDILSIIRKGYITFGNTQIDRVTPNGLLIPSVKWKTS